MNLVRDLYLDWLYFPHRRGCPQPAWEAQLKLDHGRRGRLTGTEEQVHACTAEECLHANEFRRYKVRLVCRACTAVHTISGEDVGIDRKTTAAYGYGNSPREAEGLWLWPGEQPIPGFKEDPDDWLVTRTPDMPVQAADVAGTIESYFTAGHHTRWKAQAIADPDGPHGGEQLRWARRQNELHSVEQAAAWIAAQYKPQTVEVAV